MRGSFRNFGAGYTKEEIKDRIDNPEKWQNKEEFRNSPGLQLWDSVKNLKTAAASYAAADNLSELQKQIDGKTAKAKSAEKEAKDLQEKSDNVQHFLGYELQFQPTSKTTHKAPHTQSGHPFS
ncbi:hypothetical protein SAMN02910358_01655 [Lachnospiraceae bacterium XBB1006]|nr:hypothetical protein SAMN02910358_01655 [Lachnospiraceae bacterium XBB1006]